MATEKQNDSKSSGKSDSPQLMCINLQMLRTSHTVLKSYDDAYRPFGIRATQFPVLNLIRTRGPIVARDIADETVTERSVLSRKLQVMESNGWIKRQDLPGTREKAYLITNQGTALLDEITPVRIEVQNRLLTKLSDDERNLLLSLCDKLRH